MDVAAECGVDNMSTSGAWCKVSFARQSGRAPTMLGAADAVDVAAATEATTVVGGTTDMGEWVGEVDSEVLLAIFFNKVSVRVLTFKTISL